MRTSESIFTSKILFISSLKKRDVRVKQNDIVFYEQSPTAGLNSKEPDDSTLKQIPSGEHDVILTKKMRLLSDVGTVILSLPSTVVS